MTTSHHRSNDNDYTAVRIICLGNPLHGDDGIGQRLLGKLHKIQLPNHVEAIDGGTAGMAMLPLFRNCKRVLLVDMLLVKNDKNPDTYKPGDTLFISDIQTKLNNELPGFEHGGSVKELLALLAVYLTEPPEIDFVGVVAQDCESYRTSLTPELESSLNNIAEKIKNHITSLLAFNSATG